MILTALGTSLLRKLVMELLGVFGVLLINRLGKLWVPSILSV